MSVKIRLKRAGSKKRPFYRVVVTDSRRARDSRSIEDIGYYNPIEKPAVVNVDREKVAAWTAQGAQMTDTVRSLLRQENTVHRSRREVPSFSAEVIEAKKPKKGGEKGKAKAPKPAAKPAEAAGAVAVAEAPAKAAEDAPAAEAAPEADKAEAPAAEAAPAATEPSADPAPAEDKPEA